MFNENYKDPGNIIFEIRKKIDESIKSDRYYSDSTYTDDILEWMAQPYEEKILKEDERKYLAGVIEPFKDKVKYISKIGMEQFISIVTKDGCSCCLPYFTSKKYEGMVSYYEYKLEELGL